MTVYKCDRCGKVTESVNMYILHKNSMAHNNYIASKDLCESCEKGLFRAIEKTVEYEELGGLNEQSTVKAHKRDRRKVKRN